MQRLGIDTMLVCSNVATATVDDDEVSAAQLRRLGDAAAEHGVRLAYEALAWGRYVDDYRRAWRIVELADHPAVGVCLDSFHILSRGHDPAAIEEIPGEKIFFLQLADAPALTMDVLSWSRHHRLFPGEGAFDLAAFVGHVLTPATPDPCRSRSSTTRSARPTCVRTAQQAKRSLTWLRGPGRRRRSDRCRRPPAARVDAARRLRLRRGQGRGRRRRGRHAAPARLHLPRPPPQQAGPALDPGQRPRRVQRAAGPRLGADAGGRRLRGRRPGRVRSPRPPSRGAGGLPSYAGRASRTSPPSGRRTGPRSSSPASRPATPRGCRSSRAATYRPTAC